MRRVLTLDEAAFKAKCTELQAQCADFAPDLIVGIPTGGEYVARNMFGDLPHIYLGAQRPTTHIKKGIAPRILSRLPRWLADALRVVESALLQCTAKRNERRHIDIDSMQAEQIGRSRRILVVDDACDSGITLASVVSAVGRYTSADTQIRCGVITVTTEAPAVDPHYALFRNKTLVRFPWSADARH